MRRIWIGPESELIEEMATRQIIILQCVRCGDWRAFGRDGAALCGGYARRCDGWGGC